MSNRDRLKKLIQAAGITQAKAAELIAEATGRPLTDRAVRSWLTEPDKPSYRPCPDWAITALRAVAKQGKGGARGPKDKVTDLERELSDIRQEVANHYAHAGRLIEWIRNPKRKHAVNAFTEGPERQVAYAVEDALGKKNPSKT